MTRDLIAAIDAGTTGVRCCIFDIQGNEIANGYHRMPALYPRPGWVELNAETMIDLSFRAAADAVGEASVDPARIMGLCITAIRNSFVPVDETGAFLSKMLIWQDQRGVEVHPWMLERLKMHHLDLTDLYKKNGQPFGSFQSGFKAIWLRVFREELYRGTWKLVTPQAFLTRAFGAEDFVDENNDLGSWLVADADKLCIDEEYCRLFDMDPEKFTEAVKPGTIVGQISRGASQKTGLPEGLPIFAGSGDQQCGALGAGNYGTSDIISVCLGTAGLCIAYSPMPIRHPKGVCNVQGHPAGGYTLECHSSSCMSSYQWAKGLFGENTPGSGTADQMMTALAAEAPAGSKGVLFLPWLQGAACPYFDDRARGAYIGMTLASGRSEMIRASVEGICFETRMMLECFREAKIPDPKTIRLVGGASNSDFWNQLQANIYGLPVETISAKESTALGAAIIAAVSSGAYADYRSASEAMTHTAKQYTPDPLLAKLYDKVYDNWASCYQGMSAEIFPKINAIQQDTLSME